MKSSAGAADRLHHLLHPVFTKKLGGDLRGANIRNQREFFDDEHFKLCLVLFKFLFSAFGGAVFDFIPVLFEPLLFIKRPTATIAMFRLHK